MNNFEYRKLRPFKWFVLNNFPFIEADFDAITEYELYCRLVNYVNKVIERLNSVGEQTDDLTNAFTELKNYVNNYFVNLDVQEEINNKLDEMTESGVLAEIINQQIFDELNTKINNLEEEMSRRVIYVDTFIDDLLEVEFLKNHDYVITRGYYQVGDGGEAKYFITDNPQEQLNGYTVITIKNGLYAVLDYNDEINVKQFGAKGNGIDDDIGYLQDCIDYTADKKIICKIPDGIYLISEQLLIPSFAKIYGNGRTSVIKTKDNTDLVYHTMCSANASSINARLARNDNSTFLAQGYPAVSEICTYYVHDIELKNFAINGNWNNRDLENWDKVYQTEYSNIQREPGTGLELQRVYNATLDNLYVYNSPQHNINVRAGAYCYNEGINQVAQFPSHDILINKCESNNQRYDDGITTHDSEYITIQNSLCQVLNNINGQYSQAISNGFEIDDGSRFIVVRDCISRYNVCGYQAKGHVNTPPAHDVIFQNCLAEFCHHSFRFAGTESNEYNNYDNMCRNITIDNCTSKNAYIFSNDSEWTTQCNDIECFNATSLTINNFNCIEGNPTNTNIITNISSEPRNVKIRFRGFSRNIKINGVNIIGLKNENPVENYMRIEGNSRNFIIKDLTADGYKNLPLIGYNSTSQYGYCIIDGINLSRIDETTEILSIGENVLGTRQNMFVIQN